MNVLSVDLAQAIRLVRVNPEAGQTIYGVNLTRAFESRYGFLKGPRVLEDFNFQTGVSFIHGFFNGVVIERAQVFNNGLLVETRVSTDISDEVVADMMTWGTAEAGLQLGEPEPLRIYSSTLVVHLNGYFAKNFAHFSRVASRLTKMLHGYKVTDKVAETTGFSIGVDLQGSGPSPFRLERRAGVAFSENVFFSSAPLSTQDHIALLEQIEGSIS